MDIGLCKTSPELKSERQSFVRASKFLFKTLIGECLSFLLLLTVSSVCAQPDYTFEKAYKADSLALFTKVLNQYCITSNNTYGNDTVREAYKVFEALFNPRNFDTIEGTSLSPKCFPRFDYVVVQNTLGIYFTNRIYYSPAERDSLGLIYSKMMMVDTKPRMSEYDHFMKSFGHMPYDIVKYNGEISIAQSNPVVKIDTLTDFKPNLEFLGKKVVYLTPTFDSAVNDFLKHKYLMKGKRLFDLTSDNESVARKKSLDRVLKIWYGKAGNHWELVSYPFVSKVVFDSRMSYARVSINLSYGRAEVILHKESTDWKVVVIKKIV